jgi:hypothetical protein
MRFEIAGFNAAPRLAATVAEPMSPTLPAELHAAFTTASDAYDALAASGTHLHFSLDPGTGRIAIEVQDLAGGTRSTISGSDALRVATGGCDALRVATGGELDA